MSKNEASYRCDVEGCSLSFSRCDRLVIHQRSHTGERPYICSYENCGKSYIRLQHLLRHRDIHSGETFKCAFKGCDITLKTKATLKKHVSKMHLNKVKKYKCERCGKEYKKHSLLERHKDKHTGFKRYKCSVEKCEKCFFHRNRLKQHMKMHEGYPCKHENCDVVSKTWSLHRKHVKIEHPSEFKCSECSKTFGTSWNLKCHKRTHLDTRVCFLCPKENCPRFYYDKKNLVYHIKTYHQNRPFQCKVKGCYYTFKNEEFLNKHMERSHNPNAASNRYKRKLKKKKAKLSLAHYLSGYREPSEHSSCSESDNNNNEINMALPSTSKDVPSNTSALNLNYHHQKINTSRVNQKSKTATVASDCDDLEEIEVLIKTACSDLTSYSENQEIINDSVIYGHISTSENMSMSRCEISPLQSVI